MNMNAHAVLVALFLASTATLAEAKTRSGTPAAAAPRLATTSFNFDDIPVRSALQLIAEEGHFNLILSDSVQGTISLRLVDVTWEQALDVVLRLKGLQRHIDSNTLSVTAAGE